MRPAAPRAGQTRAARALAAALLVLLSLGEHALNAQGAASDERLIEASAGRQLDADERVWFDVGNLDLEGRGWAELAAPFDRLPAAARELVRPDLWQLSRHSAGLCVRFETDATNLDARWELAHPTLARPHVAGTAVSGLDLYVRTEDGGWRWLGLGTPQAQTTVGALTRGLDPGRREFLLYLPLYNGVRSLELGLPPGARLWRAEPWAAARKPLVFYGTSITQGACASRPGMAATAIVGRLLDRPVVNLGFSSNGRLELALARLLAEIDAAVYVIDCLPNMTGQQVAARLGPFVSALREARPNTPILLIEDRVYGYAHLRLAEARRNAANHAALKAGYESLVAAGDEHLHYLSADGLLGDDGEGTVDGSHPNDLGMMRLARAWRAALEPLLAEAPQR